MKIENLSYRQGVAVTPSDTTNLPRGVCRALYTGSGGVLVVQMDEFNLPLTLTAVPAGEIMPLAVSRVLATGTTATGVHAFY